MESSERNREATIAANWLSERYRFDANARCKRLETRVLRHFDGVDFLRLLDVVGILDVSSTSYLNGIVLDNDADITGADQLVGYNDLRLYGDGSGGPDLFIAACGNVGIGTTNPGTFKLAVNGTIRAKEVKVETSWSDFVFEEDYKLISLAELEQSIKQHGHLPGVPSAEEVTANGVNVGEMQASLLQKIEELTLYVIDLKKENEAFKELVAKLGK